MQSNNQVSMDLAAEHYIDGCRRGKESERERALRIIRNEIETTSNIAHKNGSEGTREHAAVMVKLGLLYEMVRH